MNLQKFLDDNPEYIYIPGHVPSSKNSRMKTKYGKFIASPATQKWKKLAAPYIFEAKDKFLSLVQTLPKPYHIGFFFIRKTNHSFDWVNPLQTIQDEMVRMSLLDDDNMNEMIPHPLKINDKYYSVDKTHHGVLIKVLTDEQL